MLGGWEVGTRFPIEEGEEDPSTCRLPVGVPAALRTHPLQAPGSCSVLISPPPSACICWVPRDLTSQSIIFLSSHP